MAGQGFIPNKPQDVRGKNGPGGGDAPESLEQARDILAGKKTFEQAVREKPAEPSRNPERDEP